MKKAEEVAQHLFDGMRATAIVKQSIEALFGSVVRALIGQQHWENSKQNLTPQACVIEMDFAMKTMQRIPVASQSTFFGRAGMDLLGALIEILDEEGISIHGHFLDTILTTTEHTVTNFLAVLESKLRFAHSRGIRRALSEQMVQAISSFVVNSVHHFGQSLRMGARRRNVPGVVWFLGERRWKGKSRCPFLIQESQVPCLGGER
jgi:hypothetical protein